MPNKLRVTHIDTCLPESLQDHHTREGECLIGVEIDGYTTLVQVRAGLDDAAIHGGNGIPATFTYEQIKDAIRVAACFQVSDMNAIFNPNSDLAFEDEEADEESDEEPSTDITNAWFLFSWK